ncbi:MAG: pro-sigmaK processing inhibitor BofA family protein [Clostridia bacterium]
MYLFFILIWKNIYSSYKKVLKLVVNSILGGAIIYIINLIGNSFNFHIGLNFFTSILIGILGIPGAVVLVILKLLIG